MVAYGSLEAFFTLDLEAFFTLKCGDLTRANPVLGGHQPLEALQINLETAGGQHSIRRPDATLFKSLDALQTWNFTGSAAFAKATESVTKA